MSEGQYFPKYCPSESRFPVFSHHTLFYFPAILQPVVIQNKRRMPYPGLPGIKTKKMNFEREYFDQAKSKAPG